MFLKKQTLFFSCAALLLAVWGCTSDFDKFQNAKFANWEPRLAVPLLDADLGVGDIVSTKINYLPLTTDPNRGGMYVFNFYKDFYSQKAEDLITVPDQYFNVSLPGVNIPVLELPPVTYGLTLDLGADREITTVDTKKGSIDFQITSLFKSGITFSFTFPSLTKNGVALTTPVYEIAPSDGKVPQVLQANIDMSDYRMALDTDPAQPYNKLPCVLNLRRNSTDYGSTDAINIGINFSKMKFKYIEGYLGQIDFASGYKDTVSVKLFEENLKDSTIYFDDPSMYLSLRNSFGVSALMSLNDLKAILKDKKTTIPFSVSPSNLLSNVLIKPATASESSVQTFFPVINKQNSNIVDVYRPTPNKFTYKITMASEPRGANRTRQYFARDTSRVVLRALAKFPMDGRVTNYMINENFDVDLPKNENTQLTDVLLKLIIDNGMPCDADIQMYFLDDQNKRIDSIIVYDPNNYKDQRVVAKSALVNTTGRVTQAVKTESVFRISKERYQRLQQSTQKMAFVGLLKTKDANYFNDKYVQIYPEYRFGVKIGVQTKVSVNLND